MEELAMNKFAQALGLALCLSLFPAASHFAQSAYDIQLLSQWRLSNGNTTAVCVAGNYIYTNTYDGLNILDPSNPTSLRHLGQYVMSTEIKGIFVQHNYAYIANYLAGLRIIDISNPAALTEVGFYDTPGACNDVFVYGNYAYVADNYSGFRIIDVSNPASPDEVWHYNSLGPARTVFVSGNYAYLGDNQLTIIDITNPAAPIVVGSFNTYDVTPFDIAVSGHYAYIASYQKGLRIIDVSNPAAPFEIGFHDTPGRAYGVQVTGNLAYVAASLAGLRIIDVSDPTAPFEVGAYDTPSAAWNLAVTGNYAYIADTNGLRIADVSDPSAPFNAGVFRIGTPHEMAVHPSENYAYVAWGGNGVRIFDISDPTAPEQIGVYDTPGQSYGVHLSGDLLYVADWNQGLRIINVANPASPLEIGFYDTPDKATDLDVKSGYAYVADYTTGMIIIDVSNPAAPVEVGAYTQYGALQVQVSGNYAYTRYFDGILRVIDISNPAAPVLARSVWLTDITIEHFAVSGNYAYLADDYDGVYIVDISDLNNIAVIAFYPVGGQVIFRIHVAGSYVYCFNELELEIVNISDPSSPASVATLYPATFYDGFVSSNYMFATDAESFYILKFDSTATAIEADPQLPATVVLAQNYPNPFNPSTTIEFSLPKHYDAELNIFDAQGRMVETLLADRLSAGTYQVEWNAARYASGVYFYQLRLRDSGAGAAPKIVETRKLLFLK